MWYVLGRVRHAQYSPEFINTVELRDDIVPFYAGTTKLALWLQDCGVSGQKGAAISATPSLNNLWRSVLEGMCVGNA